MENRVGEKILKLLLIAGFNEQDSDPRAQKELLEKVENIVNSSILGNDWQKSNWCVNLTKENYSRPAHDQQPYTQNNQFF